MLLLLRKKPLRDANGWQRAIISKNDRFKELLALLDFEKSDSQNNLIYNFHASKNPNRTSQILFRGGSELRTNNIFWLGSLWVNLKCASGVDFALTDLGGGALDNSL